MLTWPPGANTRGPLGTLAGLSNRTDPQRIMAWAWAAARWITARPDADFVCMLDALLEYKWSELIGE